MGGCEALETSVEPGVPPADVTLTGVRLTQWQHGQASAQSTFATVAYNRAAARALADEVLFQPLDEQGRVQGTLTAKQGDGRLSDGLIDLTSGVLWRTGEDTAITDACTIDLSVELARGALPVQLTGPGYQARGDGFTAELSGARRLTLQGNVHADLDDSAGARQ